MEKPGFFNNTYAIFVKRPHLPPQAKAWGYTNKARKARAVGISARYALLCFYSDTL
jgi:hypothetical protein